MRTRQHFVAITANMLAALFPSRLPVDWCERNVRTIPIRCGFYLLNDGASHAPEDIPFKKRKNRETLMGRCRKRGSRLNRADKSLLSGPQTRPNQIKRRTEFLLFRLSTSWRECREHTLRDKPHIDCCTLLTLIRQLCGRIISVVIIKCERIRNDNYHQIMKCEHAKREHVKCECSLLHFIYLHFTSDWVSVCVRLCVHSEVV